MSADTELVNTEPLFRRETEEGSYQPLVTAFLSTDQHITLFYVCFFRKKKTYLTYIIDLLMLNSHPSAL